MLELQPAANGELIIRLTAEEAQQRGLKAGDKIEIIQFVEPKDAEEAADRLIVQHRETFEFLKDK